jgi:predicted nicotinamide N-methyase
MAGYLTRELDVEFGGAHYRVQALQDLQQFSDPHGIAERAGISSALWSLFGQPWPSGLVLAEHMLDIDIQGKRTLELGCGLALASLVLARRGADITASDYHPLAADFLAYNTRANDLPAIPFRRLDWEQPDADLGRFDLIIGSDILYERRHAELLNDVIAAHAQPHAEVIVTDPGRGNAGRFVRMLGEHGFAVEQQHMAFKADDTPPFRGRLITARR